MSKRFEQKTSKFESGVIELARECERPNPKDQQDFAFPDLNPGELLIPEPSRAMDKQEESVEILRTELGNSRRFTEAYKNEALYVSKWGWVTWNGLKWEVNETKHVWRLAKRIVDELYEEAKANHDKASKLMVEAQIAEEGSYSSKVIAEQYNEATQKARKQLQWAFKSQTAQKISSMITLAEADLPASVNEFDANPWLFNCQNGVIDLKTGNLQEHSSTDRITKLTGTEYDPDAKCPKWLLFLDRIFNGNKELINYIQRAVGYSLTGNTSEQCFFFLYGTGRNGKSTFINTISLLMGDYFKEARSQTFMMQYGQGNGANEGVAALVGARFVSASELGKGQRFDEQFIKDLTGGGDLISTRQLYKSEFTFRPVLKLWMYGNEKPQISGIDEGIWRRVRIIPFTVTIPKEEIDPNLPEKLEAEIPGILAWAVRGALDWQSEHLGLPDVIETAIQEYRVDEDVIGNFLTNYCIISNEKEVRISNLKDAFKEWGGKLSTDLLSKELKQRGYRISSKGVRHFL